MATEREARQALETMLENADWDGDAGTVTVYDLDDDSKSATFGNRDDLRKHLEAAGKAAFFAYAPSDSKFDAPAVAEEAMEPFLCDMDNVFGPAD